AAALFGEPRRRGRDRAAVLLVALTKRGVHRDVRVGGRTQRGVSLGQLPLEGVPGRGELRELAIERLRTGRELRDVRVALFALCRRGFRAGLALLTNLFDRGFGRAQCGRAVGDLFLQRLFDGDELGQLLLEPLLARGELRDLCVALLELYRRGLRVGVALL